MVKKMVVGVDGSASAQKAAAFASDLARQTKAAIVFVMVLRPPHALPFMPMEGFIVTSMGSTPEDQQRGQELLDRLSRELTGISVSRRLEFGEPAEVILQVAKDENADLIVVGARGLGPASRWVLGSVSDRVAQHAECAVTIVR